MLKRFDSNSILGAAVRGGAVLLALVVVALSCYNAWSAVLFLRPDDWTRAAVAPALFDLAVLLYAGEFAYAARGGAQRLIALVGLVAALVGTIALNVLYLDVSSAGLTMDAAARSSLSWYLVRAFELQMALHLTLHLGLVLFSPGVLSAMRDQAREWRVLSRAQELADEQTAEVEELAAERLGLATRAAVLSRLSLASGVDLRDLDDRRAAVPARSVRVPALAEASTTTTTRARPADDDPTKDPPAELVPAVELHTNGNGNGRGPGRPKKSGR